MVTRQQYAELALSLPETIAGSHFGQPDFRVQGKIFCCLERTAERGSLKIRKDVQALLVDGRPDVFVPAAGAWGDSGWTYVELAHVTLDELRELIEDAWRQIAPKRLAARVAPSTEGGAAIVLSVRAAPARRRPPAATRSEATARKRTAKQRPRAKAVTKRRSKSGG